MIAEEMGFDAVVPVSGQTYSRKNGLSGMLSSRRYRSVCYEVLKRYKNFAVIQGDRRAVREKIR